MFKRILVPTDGSDRALHAARAAIELAAHLKAAIVGLYSYSPFQILITEPTFVSPELLSEKAYVKAQTAQGKSYLSAIARHAKKAGVPFEARIVEADNPSRAIVATANASKLPCDLVFMASHGRGALIQALLGGVTTKVMALCNTPVLVYRDLKDVSPSQ